MRQLSLSEALIQLRTSHPKFLILANFLFWGINLIIKKEIKRIILKLFLVVAYLVLGTIFIYITFNNSFWLIVATIRGTN